MLVLESVSIVQAANFPAAHETATRNTIARPAIEGDVSSTHTVTSTPFGSLGVDSKRIDYERPQGIFHSETGTPSKAECSGSAHDPSKGCN